MHTSVPITKCEHFEVVRINVDALTKYAKNYWNIKFLVQISHLIKEKCPNPALKPCCHGLSTSVAMEFTILACRWRHCAETEAGSQLGCSCWMSSEKLLKKEAGRI